MVLSLGTGDRSRPASLLLESKTLSKMSAETRSSIQGLEGKIAEHHVTTYSVQERIQGMDDRTKLAQVADHEILKSVCAGVGRMDHWVVQVRHLGQQIVDCINAFSLKSQGILRATLQSPEYQGSPYVIESVKRCS